MAVTRRDEEKGAQAITSEAFKGACKWLARGKLIPLAHSVYKAYLVVLDGVSRLVKHLPVKACRKPKTKGKKGGRAYEDEDDLDAVIKGLDGPSPSVGIAVAATDEAIDVSASKKKNNKKKGGAKKGAFDLLDEEASDSEVIQTVPSLDED